VVTNGRRTSSSGSTLVEVLVTIVLVAFGLLGMAGLQVRMQLSDTESYHRAQALLLVTDMASRLAANRMSGPSYVTGAESPLGTSKDCDGLAGSTQAQLDLREWCLALQGAAESSGSHRQGAVIGGRGCVEQAADGDYMVTVVWQGLTPAGAPPASLGCGSGTYDGGAGSPCSGDRCRRFVTMLVRMGQLA
jgi:type IV pilus assembly protein PilV